MNCKQCGRTEFVYALASRQQYAGTLLRCKKCGWVEGTLTKREWAGILGMAACLISVGVYLILFRQ